ncbi:hydroxyacylglutathione hydrolase [Moraxella nasovis]|uniref:hydroxyacylglutathione hydrolase n=1 Tax=Moraxella nasovis TaxID=2904121 RepID=UPI001F615CF9|nr:hydroxyacylglutathione hydrolase [Moraxella nasovis]UNU73409.1 hydroxyacylglutathione hydrolase [Moraxella nasovis]
MRIDAIKALDDNYIWAIVKGNQAIIVDPGEAAPVLKYLKDHRLNLIAILITHHHDDHTGGVKELQQVYPSVQTFSHAEHGVNADYVNEGDTVVIDDLSFNVWHTPGHTDTHLSYLLCVGDKTHVFCADTLFSGGCGRVFTGTMQQLHDSLARFKSLPKDTLFYPAHEYTADNLRFGLMVCSDKAKPAIEQALADTLSKLKQGQISLPTLLSHEYQINVFLQTDDEELITRLQDKIELKKTDSISVFTALRKLKNEC